MNAPMILQQPSTPALQLLLLFHGVGATPADMAPLGAALAQQFPQAWVVSIPSPDACDWGQGYQWFSVQGVTEDNRPAREAQAMPGFIEVVRHWQQRAGVGEEGTALIGFSQGAIMALESTQQPQALAGRVVALAGRFAMLPEVAPPATTLHFVHGKDDAVIHYGYTVSAAEHLIGLGADLTADVLPHLGHQVSEAVVQRVLERLTTYVPQRCWQAAMSTVPEQAYFPQPGDAPSV